MLVFGIDGPNIVNRHATPLDICVLFGELNGPVEPVECLDVDCLDWTDIAVHCGFFPSKGQARKNGWVGPVPRGFGNRKFGQKGRGVWFFNPEEEVKCPAI